MSQISDPVTITVSRSVLSDVARICVGNGDRMHALLEKNTDGLLNEAERHELEALVRMAEIGQIVTLALQPPGVM